MKFLRQFLLLGIVCVSFLLPVRAAQYSIVTILPVEQTLLFERMQVGAQRFAEATGHQATVRAPATADAVQQIRIIADAIADRVNAICILPVSGDVDVMLHQASAQGVVVIGHNASALPHLQYALEPFEDEAYGVHLMMELATRMQATGEYAVMFGGRAFPDEIRRSETARALQKAQFPNMKLVTWGLEEYHDPAIAARKTRELFRAFPGLQGLLCFSETATQGAIQVIAETGRQAQVTVIGTGGMLETGATSANDTLHLVSVWEPADLGYALNMLAALLLDGETIRDGVNLRVSGYEDLRLRGNTLYGTAWIDMRP